MDRGCTIVASTLFDYSSSEGVERMVSAFGVHVVVFRDRRAVLDVVEERRKEKEKNHLGDS